MATVTITRHENRIGVETPDGLATGVFDMNALRPVAVERTGLTAAFAPAANSEQEPNRQVTRNPAAIKPSGFTV